MTRIRQFLAVCGCVLFGLSMNVVADVYRWVDKDGQVHFGDRSPEGANASKLDMPQVNTSAAPAANDAERRERQKRIIETLSTERKEREEARIKNREEKEKRLAACEKMRIKMAELASINVYYRRNEKGERVYMSDDERKAVDDKAKKKYQERCSR